MLTQAYLNNMKRTQKVTVRGTFFFDHFQLHYFQVECTKIYNYLIIISIHTALMRQFFYKKKIKTTDTELLKINQPAIYNEKSDHFRHEIRKRLMTFKNNKLNIEESRKE